MRKGIWGIALFSFMLATSFVGICHYAHSGSAVAVTAITLHEGKFRHCFCCFPRNSFIFTRNMWHIPPCSSCFCPLFSHLPSVLFVVSLIPVVRCCFRKATASFPPPQTEEEETPNAQQLFLLLLLIPDGQTGTFVVALWKDSSSSPRRL